MIVFFIASMVVGVILFILGFVAGVLGAKAYFGKDLKLAAQIKIMLAQAMVPANEPVDEKAKLA